MYISSIGLSGIIGAFLNNGVLCIQTDTKDKGKLMIDPRYGIAAGNQNLYTIGADGTSLIPSFIDGSGIKKDAAGMPENAMFYLDIRNGKAYFRGDIYAENGYFRGTVYATGGEFKGIVKATDFQTPAGVSMLKNGKFDSKYLDLGKIQIDGNSGNITMTGDINMSDASKIDLGGIVIDGAKKNISFAGAGSITWGDYEPNGIKKTVVAYAVSSSGTTAPTSGWQTTVPSVGNGQYLWTRTTITYTNGTESVSYAVGYQGRNGTTPKLPEYIQETYIDSTEIRSPTIKANDYFIYPSDEDDYTGSFVIVGSVEGSSIQRDMFRIDYNGVNTPPTTQLYADSGTTLIIGADTGHVRMKGNLDLSGANITWGNNAPIAVFG